MLTLRLRWKKNQPPLHYVYNFLNFNVCLVSFYFDGGGGQCLFGFFLFWWGGGVNVCFVSFYFDGGGGVVNVSPIFCLHIYIKIPYLLFYPKFKDAFAWILSYRVYLIQETLSKDRWNLTWIWILESFYF